MYVILNFLIKITFIALQTERNIVTVEEAQRIESYVAKVHAIRDVLKRDHMKVAFFGRYIIILIYLKKYGR